MVGLWGSSDKEGHIPDCGAWSFQMSLPFPIPCLGVTWKGHTEGSVFLLVGHVGLYVSTWPSYGTSAGSTLFWMFL